MTASWVKLGKGDTLSKCTSKREVQAVRQRQPRARYWITQRSSREEPVGAEALPGRLPASALPDRCAAQIAVLRHLLSVNRQLYTVEITLRSLAARSRPTAGARRRSGGPIHLFLWVVDHFEPQVGRAPRDVARRRLEEWLEKWPRIARKHRDADGHSPRHGFFYPWDEYDPWECQRLGELCAGGWGELEVHLHHENDTDATLRRKLREAVEAYRSAGGLSRWPDGRPAWGFIHGNWALDNSRIEGPRNYCGVNNELTVLQEEGCYADFTFPAWQHVAQPRQVNSIYYAVDDPRRPKSYERGRPAAVGRHDPSGLLLVQGPLVPFRRGYRPAMDDADLARSHRYSPARLDRWVSAGIGIKGRPDWVFVKVHTHGAADGNRQALLDEDLDALYSDAEARYNDGRRYVLHYVTARQVFNLIKAAEEGVASPSERARNWVLPPQGAVQPANTSGTLAGAGAP